MAITLRVVVESPYAGDPATIERNLAYARAAMRDCIFRGEAPFASHLLYTQPDVLKDEIRWERDLGIECGFMWGRFAHRVVVYQDLGITLGMEKGIAYYESMDVPVEFRSLDAWRPGLETEEGRTP